MLSRGVLAALALVAAIGGGDHRAEGAPAQPPTLEPPGEQLDAVFACYRRAHAETLLARAEIDEICEGAKDARPVDCYVAAHARTLLSNADAIVLCRCAATAAPVDCFREGYDTTTLAPADILRLCSPSLRQSLRPDCSPEP